MVRVLVYVVVIFLLAAGFAWLADRPGTIVLTWQGVEIRATLMVAAIALFAVIVAITAAGAILRAVLHAPSILGRFLGARRRDRGYRALSAGMIAVGAGDARLARRAADASGALLGNEPLTLLLSAQAAQLAGDGERARAAFEALAARKDTRVLGLHGLFVEARRQGEHAAARHFAEEAAIAAPASGWAGTALFEYQARAGDWLAALRTLAGNAGAHLVDKAEARRLRGVLLTARAMQLEPGDPAEARAAALEAHRLTPDLAPPAVVASRLLTRAGDVRRAAKVLETAWKAAPHPEIAEAYAAVRTGDSVRDRLKRMRRLAELRPDHAEAAMALARAAIDAHEWAVARNALESLVKSQPSERVCLLMAEIEERENGDQGRVRTWLTRALSAPRDPAWVADGEIFQRWAPVSPAGHVGAFAWKVVEHPPRREALAIEVHDKAEASASGPGENGAAETVDGSRFVEATDIAAPAAATDTVLESPPTAPRVLPLAPPFAGEPARPAMAPASLPRSRAIPAPDDPGPPGATPPRRRFWLF
jgi:HemY protein